MLGRSVLVASFFALLATCNPQYAPPDPLTTSTTSSSSAAASATGGGNGFAGGTMDVTVSPGGQLAYSPANFTASNGTVIRFLFPTTGLQHSVTQTTLQTPCTPLSGGFDSGLTEGTAFSIMITNDQTPIYFMCKFPAHCGQGMVGAINAPTSGQGSFDDLQSAATGIGVNEAQISFTGFSAGGSGAIATSPPGTNTGALPTSSSGSSSSGAPSPSPTNQSSSATRHSALAAVGELLVAAALAVFAL